MIVSLPWATGWVKRNAPRPPAYLNLIISLVAFVHGSLAFNDVLQTGSHIIQFPWLNQADLRLSIILDISPTNLAVLELITGLSFLSQLYALGYLDKEWALARFFALAGFFEGAMSGVVLSASLFQSYFLLEMLTLSTYLLVGFWYAQPLVVTAARDAFLTKRVGDILLLMGVVSLSALAGGMDFDNLYKWADQNTLTTLTSTLLGLALIAGPTGKCAQFPMHLWLDEAMEGPNPASILRNSVVVAVGALVLLKLMPILQYSPVTIAVLLAIGIISALGGSLVSIAQVDIKRTLSYSTTAYLGLVFIAIALQQSSLALLILFAHGVAKALLSMSIGSVIAVSNCQDITELGGLANRMPATTSAYLLGAAGLTGLIPLGCFWCFGLSIELFSKQAPWLAAVYLLTNTLTALNLTRVFRQVFLGNPMTKTRRAIEVNWQMALPMVILMVITILTPWMMTKIGILPAISAFSLEAAIVVAISGLTGVMIGIMLPLNKAWSRSIKQSVRWLQDLLAFDFYTDRFYRLTIVNIVSSFSRLAAWFDTNIVNGLVNYIGRFSLDSAEGLRLSVSGRSQTYILTVVITIVFLLASLSWLAS
ncbi:NADH dehydrogenase subunit L (chromatophore) [Paulinella micropora]|uniref:NADH dehydrogenase subunit L n=1 Tax=Paulinella micropora TaxID=1928728 RepID=A0A1L5YD81_9EUKA|nr:NADH dehydrogenase subunit L [Paulinella micropora]AQX45428.1 NADH dehydrogenase subunit L [Paulinella micropora]BBL86648.1 NADH dehydrogenase subunit L [Paulinella micropora]